MANCLLKNFFPKLIIIEGQWGAGKTTLAKYLAKKYSLVFIKEPRNQNLTDESRISTWYLNQHIKRQIQARTIDSSKKIIMERSIISNAAYQYAKRGYINDKIRKIILKFSELKSATILFLYYDLTSLNFKSTADRSECSMANQYPPEDFIKRYFEFYRLVLPKIIGNRLIFLKTKEAKKFLTVEQISRNFQRKYISLLKSKRRKKIKSGSAIIFYKKKVLLIYDKKWRHYVFPQGKKKGKENMLATTIREIREETGYFDIEPLKFLLNYHYYYKDVKNLINKQITVYAFKLKSLKRSDKMLEAHENYKNKFVPPDKAIKLLKWREDKIALRKTIKKSVYIR